MAGKRGRKNTSNANAASVNQLAGLLRQLIVSQAGPSKAQPTPKRRRQRKRKNNVANNTMAQDGAITLTRTELIDSLRIPANSSAAHGHIDIIPDSFSFLKNLFKSFERLRWKKFNVYYKPAVGTSYGGLVTVGVDWDFSGTGDTRTQVASYTPTFTVAAWADNQNRPMVLPPNRLQSKNWYTPRSDDWEDKGPGRLAWAVEGAGNTNEVTLGEIWVAYTVQFMGTNPQ